MLIVDGEVQKLNRPDLNGFMDCTDGCTTTSLQDNMLDFTHASSQGSSGCKGSSTTCKDYSSADATYYRIADGNGYVWSIYDIGLFVNPYEMNFESYQVDENLWSPSDFRATSGTWSYVTLPKGVMRVMLSSIV